MEDRFPNNNKVKKYDIKSSEIKDNKCEICQQDAVTGLLDAKNNIRYACLRHIKDLYVKFTKK